jgi:maltooligosyltrehalose trehalohydrolase
MKRAFRLGFGASPDASGTSFRVWAPRSESVDVVLYGPEAERVHPLGAEADGWFSGHIQNVGAGARYRYRLDGEHSYPDPASRSQPDGVHGPSEVVDPAAYRWADDEWSGVPLDEMVIYELHVGAATPEGSFDALIGRLDDLVALGVNTIEVMPIAGFPGERNWGYDGVNLYAPAHPYGGPDGFKRFVDAAHARGLAVILDVVYNHFGPEGNYLPAITGGCFFTDRHHTPWGDAINYDQPGSGVVREFVIRNALFWVHEYHVDGLRLDATHAIIDDSPKHLLQELAERVHASADRPIVLIAEDERNDRRLLLPPPDGFGLDAVWADDFHHQLRRLTAGDDEGYFTAFRGTTQDLSGTLARGWWYEGQVSPFTGEARGTPAGDLPPRCFVHCIQNHDQVGNRALGERLNHEIEPALYRVASALLLLSPYTPLLWMGQEWAASSPFLYFTDHPGELGRLVTEGRREEFKHFSAFADPERRERIPDPQAEETFRRSKLDWAERERAPHAQVLAFYQALLALRREEPAMRVRTRGGFAAHAVAERTLLLRRAAPAAADVLVVANWGGEQRIELGRFGSADAPWEIVLASEDPHFGGEGGWGGLAAGGSTLTLGRACAVVLRQSAL